MLEPFSAFAVALYCRLHEGLWVEYPGVRIRYDAIFSAVEAVPGCDLSGQDGVELAFVWVEPPRDPSETGSNIRRPSD